MKPSRLTSFTFTVAACIGYAFVSMLVVDFFHKNVSVGYIFILPIIMGAIPVFFKTREQLSAYWQIILIPWFSVLFFFMLSFFTGFEGMICLVIIVGPFLILGTLGAFIAKFIRLKSAGKQTPLFPLLVLPFLVISIESFFEATDQFHTIHTTITVSAPAEHVWTNIKNVRDIRSKEVPLHFVHLIGVPKPLNGELDREEVGGSRYITWENGIRFVEKIKTWQEGAGFTYDILVDPLSIPPTTLDEHVMIGGRYFDVVEGGYHLKQISHSETEIELWCTYRITTNLHFYGKWWADLILNDFNVMILQVIKNRCENRN